MPRIVKGLTMSFSLLRQFFADFEVPPELELLTTVVANAQHVRFPDGVTRPDDAREIFGPDLGASFRLPHPEPTAIEDATSCVVLWDCFKGQTGLTEMRNFLLVTRLPVHVLPIAGKDAEALRRQIEELQRGGCSIQLVWGALADFKFLKFRPPENVMGKCIPVGWHFRSLSTDCKATAVGHMNPLLLQLQPIVFTHVLTALEELAYLGRQQ